MKLLLTIVALAAFTRASPISTQSMETGANGVQSDSEATIFLVKIIVKMIKNAAEVPETANEHVLGAEPVIIVKGTQNLPEPENSIDVMSINPILKDQEVVPAHVLSDPSNPIDMISVDPVAPQPEVLPAPIDLLEPIPAEVVPVPFHLPEPIPAEVVPASIDLPEPIPAKVVPAPIDLPEPIPAEVVPAPIDLPEPIPAEVEPASILVPEPAPAEDNEVEPTANVPAAINVMLNFVFGNSNTMSAI